MSASVSSALAASSTTSLATPGGLRRQCCRSSSRCSFTSRPFTSSIHHPFILRVTNDSSRTEMSSAEPTNERSEADKIVDGMDFGELCNEFECVSSPLVESTARQLVRDILELREGNRALGTYAVSVRYKCHANRAAAAVALEQRSTDPFRSFIGREKYKRPLWATGALDNPSADFADLVKSLTNRMSTSEENIEMYPDPSGDPTKNTITRN
ncbi:unnamed protein product [Dovyalis caffra]|uniref:Uncharacterized protein n=1 Tax=Dovyalis caffra TaxID=77055 RepID=A0AAV1RUX0_9ROSI|nr:unnamed protein product [Dovyalis caffra]